MTSKFFTPNSNKIESWKSELKYHRPLEHLVIQHNSKHWLIKSEDYPQMREREILASVLGRNLVNIAESKTLVEADLNLVRELGIKIRDTASVNNTILSRLAQDYLTKELPQQSLDTAVAGELVFSVWIRRRDAHEYNRAYNPDGIPIFFDGHASLGFEPEQLDIDNFFNHEGAGFAGSWRVKETTDPYNIVDMRSGNWGGTHYIRNKQDFLQGITTIVSAIENDTRDYRSLIIDAGLANDAYSMEALLQKNKNSLRKDTDKLLEVIFKSG